MDFEAILWQKLMGCVQGVRLGKEKEPRGGAGEKSWVEESPVASLQYHSIVSQVLNKKKK